MNLNDDDFAQLTVFLKLVLDDLISMFLIGFRNIEIPQK